MKKFALLLAFVAPVFAAGDDPVFGWRVGPMGRGDLPVAWNPNVDNLRNAWENIFPNLREWLIVDPRHEVRPPPAPGAGAPNPGDLVELREDIEEMMRIEHGGDGRGTFMVQLFTFWDELCRGGRLSVSVLSWLVNPNAKRDNVDLGTILPASNVTIGTFVDMTKNKTYTPPKDVTVAPPRNSNPLSKGKAQNLCKRKDVDPMRMCAAMPGTIVSKQAITMTQSLRSITGNILSFDGLGNLEIIRGDRYYWTMGNGSIKKPPGPYYAYLETDGNLCLYDGNGKNYKCSGPTGPNDGQYRLIMQDDGNLVIYRGKGIDKPIWASGTNFFPNIGPVKCIG
ncbi:hypothetical protein BGX26_007247, partial [Mortierella sp. AD094]